jgi:hypothetical protein
VRQDLPLADQIVQTGHACLEGAAAFDVPNSCRLVVLGVPDAEALLAARQRCLERDIKTVAFHERDAALEVSDEPMGLTSICTQPLTAEQRKQMRKYRMWKSGC